MGEKKNSRMRKKRRQDPEGRVVQIGYHEGGDQFGEQETAHKGIVGH